MGKVFGKSVFRPIWQTPRRFIAILLMVLMGVAFYTGVRSAGPDMRLTLDRYFDDYNAADVRLVSTLGFDEDDVNALKSLEGLAALSPGYSVDGFLAREDSPLLVQFVSMDFPAVAEHPQTILNRPVLVEGRLPRSEDECLLDTKLMRAYDIGDTLTIQEENDEDITDSLSRTAYTIVGSVRILEYIDLARGSTAKGKGSLDGFVLLPQEVFTLEVYTQVALQMEREPDSRFSEDYKTAAEDFCDRIEALGLTRNPVRYQALYDKARAELDEGLQEVADGEAELQEALDKLTDGERELADGERDYAEGLAELETELTNAKQELDDSAKTLDDVETELTKSRKTLKEGRSKLQEGWDAWEKGVKETQEGRTALEQLDAAIQGMEGQLALMQPQDEGYPVLAAQLAQSKQLYQENRAALATGEKQLAATRKTLEKNEKTLKEGEVALQKGEEELAEGRTQWEEGMEAYQEAKADGEKKLQEARAELDEAAAELADGWREYNEEAADARRELADAREELADGEEKLAELKTPEWFPLDLRKNAGFAGYEMDTERVAAIGHVFPLLFFLVAALVSLTNMTRMVEDDRGVMGIQKALGYGRFAIALRYLVYAGLAAAAGIGLGVSLGSVIFPRIIADAYGMLYTLPPLLTPVNYDVAAIAGGGALLCAVLPAFLVCQAELQSPASALMRPRAPKVGKRILLERIGFVWRHLNFSAKVTCRNVFRYKKRLLMTILGVAGCTALIFTGFGLKHAIQMMLPKQFDQLQQYDVRITLEEDMTAARRGRLEAVFGDERYITGLLNTHEQSIDVHGGSVMKTAGLVVPLDKEALPDFITLRERKNGDGVALTDHGVVITEKLATLLDVQPGDTLRLQDTDNLVTEVRVDGIAENYVYHYVYMTPVCYQTLYGREAAPNAVLCHMTQEAVENRHDLSETLMDTGGVQALSFAAASRDSFHDMLGALDIIVLVLLLSAALLAFVVLFSLTGINIDERKRELASLKVLGFYEKETALYIYRENFILTLLGIGAGFGLGILLLFFVINTAEVDMVMFARETNWSNYLLSGLITIGFSLLVNVLTLHMLRKIHMLEALGSIE